MTSNGNTAQKHLIKTLTETHQNPKRGIKGGTMTAEEMETLKQAQKQALKGGNIEEINRINKILFEERERRQRAKEQTREQKREKVLSAKISSFCEKMLSEENEREL